MELNFISDVDNYEKLTDKALRMFLDKINRVITKKPDRSGCGLVCKRNPGNEYEHSLVKTTHGGIAHDL